MVIWLCSAVQRKLCDDMKLWINLMQEYKNGIRRTQIIMYNFLFVFSESAYIQMLSTVIYFYMHWYCKRRNRKLTSAHEKKIYSIFPSLLYNIKDVLVVVTKIKKITSALRKPNLLSHRLSFLTDLLAYFYLI